jgi:CRISPR-associated protein Csb1
MKLDSFDQYLNGNEIAALVLRDELSPVEGDDGIFFPPTFAPTEDGKTFTGGYNIDGDRNGTNVCLVDSVGSQANRIEPIFSKPGYEGLVPKITITAGSRTVNLLEAGHRAGDAIVRCTSLQSSIRGAFLDLRKGNAIPLSKISPTSLVFGVWDSRDTQAKSPRVVASTIRAFDVRPYTRSATYLPSAEYINDGLLADHGGSKADRDKYSKRGFLHALASSTHGGVRATGGIRREATLSLAALRSVPAQSNDILPLHRYLFGLALTALTATTSTYLRQGCNLVLSATRSPSRSLTAVRSSGERKALTLSHDEAIAYAKAAAGAFKVGCDQAVSFDKELAKQDLVDEKTGKATKTTKPKKGE